MTGGTISNRPVVDPLRLSAALGLGVEAVLRDQAPPPLRMTNPWDAWWVAVRSGGLVRPTITDDDSCTDCARAVRVQLAAPVPGAVTETLPCECFTRWATAMRNPAVGSRRWALPQRLTVALLKPGAPSGPIRARLRRRFRFVHDAEVRLTPADCTRLYPDAYGADFIAATAEYLTSGPSRVLVLQGGNDAVTCGLDIKRAVRTELGADRMRNHLHMPDTPADALTDIGLLTGLATLRDAYHRWELHHEPHYRVRMASYRARLDRDRDTYGMALCDG